MWKNNPNTNKYEMVSSTSMVLVHTVPNLLQPHSFTQPLCTPTHNHVRDPHKIVYSVKWISHMIVRGCVSGVVKFLCTVSIK